MISVQIVDDHRILVDGMLRLINESGIAQVTGTAYCGKEALEMLRLKEPHVLLLDINLPDANGVDLCATIKEKYPNVKVIALTSFGEYTVVRRMLEAGANGYVLKNAMAEEVLDGIECVASGDTFLCDEVDLLMKKQSSSAIWLTPRERELLKLIVEGYTNPEIADKIFLGVETVNSYRKNLLFKLNARNTAVLVKMAIEQKLI